MSKLSGIISKGFKSEKCKVSLRMAMARIKLLRNKRDAQIKQMRRDVAQLLESGQDQTARIRVEHVIREEKTMAAYELIELYCELIIARLPIIDSQKNCPLDLKEAITSVIFASPRCADVAELMDIRKQFVSKYGKEFATCALELRPNSGVSPLVIEKLSAKAPDLEMKVKTLTSIAEEHNVNWDCKELLEQIQNPKKDLISGSTHFPSASQFYSDSYSSNVQASFEPQNNKPHENILHQQNIPIPSQEYPSPQFEPNSAESSLREEEEEKAEHKYKSAKDAARAAAESAERAHLAAIAAAELANRKNTTKSEEFPPQNVHKEEKEEEETNVVMFDRSDSDDSEDRSVFEPYEETDLVDSFLDKKKEESSHFEGEYSSHFGFSSRDKEESSHYANNSSGPTYDSDGISSEDEKENENAKKMESFSIYDDEEKEEHAQISYDDGDNEEGLGFKFGKLRGGLKNKPHQNQPRYVRKSIFNDDGDLRSDKELKGYADSSSDEEERNEALNDEKKKNKSSELKEGKTGIIEESSSESSNASLHVHPRLPSDYDSFAAHFDSLRSDRP